MAKSGTALTQRAAEAFRCAPGKDEAFLWSPDLKGFGVRARSSGARTWVVKYRPGAGGRTAPTRKVALGTVGEVSLAEAKRHARQLLGEVAAGGDPAARRARERREERVTVARAVEL